MQSHSLCFEELYHARDQGQIELEDYLQQLVVHYSGLRHEIDMEGKRPYVPAGFEEEVRNVVLHPGFQPLDEDQTTAIFQIFLSALQRDIVTTGKIIKSSGIAANYYLRPLFAMANIKGIPELLRLCLEMGPLPDRYTHSGWILSRRVANDPSTEWLDVLFDFDFREWRTNPQQLNEWNTWRHILKMNVDCTRWWIEHGGRTTSARDLFFEDSGWPGAPIFRVLLEHFGIEWFADSGALQLAVSKLDFNTVKLLVEAGADVNERVTDWQMDIREGRAAPLTAIHEAVYAKSEEMIRYLAGHGAKLARNYVYNEHNPRRVELKPYMDLVIELGAVE